MRFITPVGWKHAIFVIPIKLHGRIKVDAWREGLAMNEKVSRILWGHYFKSSLPKKPDRRR